ncbi:DoxX family protein [Nocardioides piscis]|uniref:DoxX family protein n=1 Tax=Nocardioides piscis TaxID=2714938 RepID=A0A6G7YCT2_9ACTN|nr:DoxX family protein [Nocardioides piscis]QIK74714.1 DoxX family protein [Nocardioides piscis]
MNTVLWILQIVLALIFLGAGLLKTTRSLAALETRVGGWVHDVPLPVIRLTGVAEVLGAAGLILPRGLDVAPALTYLAAGGLAIAMVGGMVVHAKRGEHKEVAVNVVLLLLTLFVAVGRF